MSSDFKTRFERGDGLLGTFIKSPAYQPTEILAAAGFDFIVIDEEHAPFNRETVDMIILAAKAGNIASLVRVPLASPSAILSVLDCGADGVLVPHVSSVEIAKEVAAAARYAGGKRGYSPSGRAGHYGKTTMQEHIRNQDAKITTIAMIEDPHALDVIDDIVAVEGISGVFIGRGDLSAAYGAKDASDQRVTNAVTTIITAARKQKKPVCMMVASPELAKGFADQGASSFIIGSDQSLMRIGAQNTLAAYGDLSSRNNKSS